MTKLRLNFSAQAILLLSVMFLPLQLRGQTSTPSSADIFLNLKKLNVVGSVLHIAAHPDDENTLMLSYMSKDQLLRTGYLSLTRGDGGQNLIGPEQGYNIGLIRTQELLAARRTDGAQQFFSRAYDFGFSKTMEETLNFWNRDKVLGDVVWIIRKFQPDVIITRFPPDARAGHGHHQSSAYLAEEAFKLAGDPRSYADQLKYVKTWQAKRLVWNTYTPGFTNKAPSDENNTFTPLEIGGFNPVLGKSYTEMAAEGRSQHKSQGFGSSPVRGSRTDYFLNKAGVPGVKNIFDGIDVTWKRIPGSENVQVLVGDLIRNYAIQNPAASVPGLLKLNLALARLDTSNMYVKAKKEDIKNLIADCLGLWFETNPRDFSGVAGIPTNMNISIVLRNSYPVKLVSLRWTGKDADSTVNMDLGNNNAQTFAIRTVLPENLKISQPYWLEKPLDKGTFQIDDQRDVGFPENRPETKTRYVFEISGQRFEFSKPWAYKYTNPAEGEIYRPFEIRPAVTVNIADPVVLFPSSTPKIITLMVEAQQTGVTGKVALDLPTGWKCEPLSADFNIPEKYHEQTFQFTVTPPATLQEITVKALAVANGKTFDRSIKTISYRHIPSQTLFPPAESKFVRTDIKTTATRIGYIAGAGDDVPAALQQIGCQVTMLSEAELSKDLSVYDAIVVGVRAYNTENRLINDQAKLMDYVKNGGTMVVQYVIPGGQKVSEIGPFHLQTGRDRITEEDAVLKFLAPDSRLLNFPNKITDTDFAGWIQERGLYFAQEWDRTHYQALLSGNDKGESPKEGSLLYAPYGKGHYIYTGLSFFRELPAGVTGAYRLFANLISAGKK
jgi:LmbE family N-acetylglucosaminyl deacetylase